MTNCVFCQILEKNNIDHLIYEDSLCFAILDAYPLTYGHTLIIPKVHTDKVQNLAPCIKSHIFEVASSLSASVEKSVNASASHILINNGKSAYQHVPHVHIHIIPRRSSSFIEVFVGLLRRFLYHFRVLSNTTSKKDLLGKIKRIIQD